MFLNEDIVVPIFPIWEKKGKIARFIEISRDITKRKRDENEQTRILEKMVEERTRQLQETHKKLLHQDKMASLGKLSSSVVHEINNPLSGILNYIKLMIRVIEKDEAVLLNKSLGQIQNQMQNQMQNLSF